MTKIAGVLVALMILNDWTMHLEGYFFGWVWMMDNDPRTEFFLMGSDLQYNLVWSIYWGIALVLMIPVIWRTKWSRSSP